MKRPLVRARLASSTWVKSSKRQASTPASAEHRLHDVGGPGGGPSGVFTSRSSIATREGRPPPQSVPHREPPRRTRSPGTRVARTDDGRWSHGCAAVPTRVSNNAFLDDRRAKRGVRAASGATARCVTRCGSVDPVALPLERVGAAATRRRRDRSRRSARQSTGAPATYSVAEGRPALAANPPDRGRARRASSSSGSSRNCRTIPVSVGCGPISTNQR